MKHLFLYIFLCLSFKAVLAENSINEATNSALLSIEKGNEIDFELLYGDYPLESLGEISRGANDHRAVMAQWELAVQSKNSAVINPVNPFKFPRENIQRFIGFVEGRLNIDLPVWWEETACTARSFGPKFMLDMEVQKSSKWRDSKESFFWLHENVKSAYATGSELEAVLKNESDPVTLDFSKEIPTKFYLDNPSTCINISQPDALYVTIHTSVGRMYKISKFNPGRKEAVWSRSVWTMPNPPTGSSGIPRQGHYSEMIFTDETVYVVGATPGGGPGVIYLEGFSRTSGNPTIRFSSEYP